MAYKLVLLPGDGTGPEVMREAVKVLKAIQDSFGLSFETIPFPAGGQYYLDTGAEWPDGAFESCKSADAILLGAVGLPEATLPNGEVAGVGVVFGLRFGLDLYANVRPTKLYPNVRHKVHDGFKQVWEPGKVDFVIVRENTEGLYTPARGGQPDHHPKRRRARDPFRLRTLPAEVGRAGGSDAPRDLRRQVERDRRLQTLPTNLR